MTTGDAGGGPAGPFKYHVALPYASTQRGYVEQVAAALKARGVDCVYDADEPVQLWCGSLSEELPRVYEQASMAVVLFISAEYATKPLDEPRTPGCPQPGAVDRQGIVLLARFDDTSLPSVRNDMHVVDPRGYSPTRFALLMAGKPAGIGITGVLTAQPARRTPGVPTWMDTAAATLAGTVRSQWTDELALHPVNVRSPLPVRWLPASDLVPAWDALERLATGGSGWPGPAPPGTWTESPREPAGGGREPAGVLKRLPTGRLVVLGEPGTDKTTLAEGRVVDLLTPPPPGEPRTVHSRASSRNGHRARPLPRNFRRSAPSRRCHARSRDPPAASPCSRAGIPP